MENSRNFIEKCELYRSEGWTVNAVGIAEKRTGSSTKTLRVVDDNEYDKWHTLPKNAEPYDCVISYCLDINKRINHGEIPEFINGSVPSAWIDYVGLDRNIAIHKAAYDAAKKDLQNACGSLYKRSGSRFVKAFA